MRPAWGRKALNSRREAAELTKHSDPKYSADQFGYAGAMAFRLAGKVQEEKERRTARIALTCFHHYLGYYEGTRDPLKIKTVHEIQGKMEGLRALLHKA